MAQLAVAAVGAVAGFALGGPVGAAIGFSFGSVAGGLLFAPKVRTEGPKLAEYRTTRSTYGSTLPIVYGAARCGVQVIWQAEPVDTANERKVGKNQYYTEWTRTQSFMVAACAGPVQGIKRVWFNSQLVYSAEHTDVVEALRSGAFLEYATFFLGAEDQLPWAVAEAAEEGGVVPAYRGVVCIGFEALDITEWGSIPQINVEVVEFATDSVPHLINTNAMQSQSLEWYQDEYQIWSTSWITALSNKAIYSYSAWTCRLRDIRYDDDGFDSPPPYGNVIRKVDGGFAIAKLAGAADADPEGRRIEPFLSPFVVGASAYYSRPYTAPCINDPRIGFQIVIGYLDGTAEGWKIMPALLVRYEEDDYTGFIIVGISSDEVTSHLVRVGDAVYFVERIDSTTRRVARVDLKLRDLYQVVQRAGGSVEEWAGSARVPSGSLFSQDFSGLNNGDDWIGVDEVTGDVWVRFADEEVLYRFTADLVLYRVDPDDPESVPLSWSGLAVAPGALNAAHVWNNQIAIADDWGLDSDYTFGQYRLLDDGTVELMGQASAEAAGLDVLGDEATPYFIPLENGVFFTYTSQWTMAPRLTGAGRTLDEVVTLLTDPVIATADLDVADVDDITVRGYLLENRSSRRAALEPLMQAYGCYAVESDDQLAVRKRGTASVETVRYRDLAAERDGADAAAPRETRTRARTAVIPARVDVQYMQVDAGYEVGNQIATRQHGDSEQVLSVPLPVAMTDAEAAQAAWRLLADGWATRSTREWSTTYRYLALEPGDVITAERADGTGARERIISRQDDDGVLTFSSVSDDAGAVVQVSAGVSGPTAPGIVLPPPQATGVPFECPPLDELDEDYLVVYGAAGISDATRTWPGGTWFVGTVDDATIAAAGTASTVSITGTAGSALPDWDVATDRQQHVTSRLTVSVGAAPDEYSIAEQMAGSGLALVGRELIRYRSATAASGGYLLDGIQRGVLGTDYASTDHAAGDRVVLLPDLTAAAVVRIPRAAAELGNLHRYRCVTNRREVLGAPSVVHEFRGDVLKPLAPAHLRIALQSNGDRKISWTRRNRAYQDLWLTGVDVPNSEDTETYSVQILDDAGTVLRETTVTDTTSYTYTDANWRTDFDNVPPTTIRVKVAQVSAIVGAGQWADVAVPNTGSGVTVLLLEFEGSDGATTTTDSTGRHTVTMAGGAEIDTGRYAVGASSALIDAAGEYVQVPNSSDFWFGDEDFVVTARIYTTTVAAGIGTIAVYVKSPATANTDYSWGLYRSGSSIIGQVFSGSTAYGATPVGTISANTWHKVTMKRVGNSLIRMIDDVQVGSTIDLTGVSLNNPSGAVVRLGEHFTYYPWTGSIDQVLVRKFTSSET